MSDTKRLTPKEKAEALDSEGRCIACGKISSKRKRGLCVADYERYRRAAAQAKADLRDFSDWEDELIEDGLLLPDARTSRDPYMDKLREIRERYRKQEAAELDEIVEEGREDIAAATKRHRAKKAGKKPNDSTRKKSS